MWEIQQGTCPTHLAVFNDCQFDSMVTDPPAGIGFMGKNWDKDKGGRDAWIEDMAATYRECLRVLKPGSHGLVWALPRTSHWTATALEDAGFQIRDVVHHLFGTGFPKSLDVSKAIDKAAGHWRGRAGAVVIESQPSKGTEYERGDKGSPITDAAKQWDGWGTALKPAAEHWILVRKPLIGTVADNVMEHGTGGINVDGCRVGISGGTAGSGYPGTGLLGIGGSATITDIGKGRWPPHVVLDDEAAAMLDEQSGWSSTKKRIGRRSGKAAGSLGAFAGQDDVWMGHTDWGGASRFFPRFRYQAKPSTKEKTAGLEHLPTLSGGDPTGRKDGSDGTKSPRAGAGRTGNARNPHPTVKPIELMRWLCRLITPPGGTVLDPFTGSGTTGCAAVLEGFGFVGVEQSAEYIEVARSRIAHWERAANDGLGS